MLDEVNLTNSGKGSCLVKAHKIWWMSFNIGKLNDYFWLVSHNDWLAIVCYGFVGHYDCPRIVILFFPHRCQPLRIYCSGNHVGGDENSTFSIYRWVGRWGTVGGAGSGWEKFQKPKKKKTGARWWENKVAKKNWDQGWSALISAEKRQTKSVNLGWDRDRKDNPISTPSVPVGPLVGAGSLAGVNQQPPMHQLRMSPFNPFCGWTSSLPVEIFFFTSSLPRNSLPPPSYLPPPTYHLPTPPPLTPSPELQRPRVAVERELERLELDQLELERDPRAHEKVRCSRFFVFFVCFVWRRLEKSSSFFAVEEKEGDGSVAAIAFFFFLFLCCTAAQLQRNKEEGLLLLLFCSRRRRPSSSSH